MNKHSQLTKVLIMLLFAEITYKHEENIPHAHEDIRAIILPTDLMNVSGITHLT